MKKLFTALCIVIISSATSTYGMEEGMSSFTNTNSSMCNQLAFNQSHSTYYPAQLWSPEFQQTLYCIQRGGPYFSYVGLKIGYWLGKKPKDIHHIMRDVVVTSVGGLSLGYLVASILSDGYQNNAYAQGVAEVITYTSGTLLGFVTSEPF